MCDYNIPTEEQKEIVRKHFNTTKTRLTEDVAIIQAWLISQKYLPHDVDDEFIEKTILRCKNSIERTKKKLECYFYTKHVYRDTFHNIVNIVPTKESLYFLPLPELTENNEMVFLFKLKDFGHDCFNQEKIVELGGLLAELTFHLNYCTGERLLIDSQNITLAHVSRLNLPTLAKLAADFQASFPARIKSVEIINLPNYMNIVMTFAKALLGPKLIDRLKCHANLDSLYDSIPKKILPKDYGGDLPPISELLMKWDTFVEKNRNVLKRSIEEYYAIEKNNDEDISNYKDISNWQGTFRTLAID